MYLLPPFYGFPPAALQGRYNQADPLYERAMVIIEATLGGEHPELAAVLNNRASSLEYQVNVELWSLSLTFCKAIFVGQLLWLFGFCSMFRFHTMSAPSRARIMGRGQCANVLALAHHHRERLGALQTAAFQST